MSIREKFYDNMKRRNGSFIPYDIYLCPSLHEEFKKRTGQEDYIEYYDVPVRWMSADYTGSRDKFSKYHEKADFENNEVNEWGALYKRGFLAHFAQMLHPTQSFETIEEFKEYPYPDPILDFDLDGIPAKVAAIKQMDKIVIAGMQMTIFEAAWRMRGLERFLTDMMLDPELAIYQLDRVTEIRCIMAERYARAGCDVLSMGDDVSTQLDMMISPDMWREFLKPRLAKIIKTATDINPDMMIFYHGDGNLLKIIPELIEIGVEILNPVQPECMDPLEVKKMYGDKLSFWGTLGTQTTMPFGTPEEVRAVCRKRIAEIGAGGGLVLAPTHILEPEVTWDNINAFLDTVREYNAM